MQERLLGQFRPLRYLRRVYCAGPLFNESERQQMEQIAQLLMDAGFEPFVPHRDGMEFAQVQPYLAGQGYDAATVGQILHEAVFALDTYQVVLGCGVLVCNLNGRVPDEGAVAEAAMAWTLGKPIICFKDDCRSMVTGRDNPLVVGMSDFAVVRRMEDIPAAVNRRLTELDLDTHFEAACPLHLQPTLHRGRVLSERLVALGDVRPNDQVAKIILDLFDPERARLPVAVPIG